MADQPGNGDTWTVRPLTTHGTEIHALVGAQFRGSPAAITAADDSNVRVWDLITGNLLLAQRADPPVAIRTDIPTPNALAVHKSSLYAGWSDGTLVTLDLDTGLETANKQVRTDAGLTAIEPFTQSGIGPWWLVATIKGQVMLGPTARSERYVLRTSGMPVSSLASVDLDERRIAVGGAGDGMIARWEITSTSTDDLAPIDIGWSKRSRLLVRAVPLPDRPLIVATDFDQLVLVDAESGDVLGRSESGVGEVSAIEPFLLDGQPAMVVGGVDGTVAVIDPLSTRSADRPADQVKGAAGRGAGRPGTIPPARLLLDPIPTGEPVAALGSVEYEGRDVILVGGQRGGEGDCRPQE